MFPGRCEGIGVCYVLGSLAGSFHLCDGYDRREFHLGAINLVVLIKAGAWPWRYDSKLYVQINFHCN